MTVRRKRSIKEKVGRELIRFGRRLATLTPASPLQTYDAHTLHLMLNRVYDLPDVVVDRDRPATINVLVPAFDFNSISAGFFGVFQVARFLRSSGWNVRLVMFDNFYFSLPEFRQKFLEYPGMEHLLTELEIEYIGERKAPMRVSPHDVCMATVWYSAHFARKIGDALGGRRFLYLIQDYETHFFPGNSLFALADETYEMDYVALFSTEPLRRYFVQHDVGGFATRGLPGIVFNNACAANLLSKEAFLRRHANKKKKKLVFYSRPVVDRNMFQLAAVALVTAYQKGIFNPEEWECIGMGLGDADVELLEGVRSTTLPRMTLREYTEKMTEFDVCLTLMASPHPSLIPMDCGGSGTVVVTNTFRTKTAEYLHGLCKNIHPVEPNLHALVAGLAGATLAAEDLVARHQHASEMKYPRRWEEALTPSHAVFIERELLNPVTHSKRLSASERMRHRLDGRRAASSVEAK